MALPFRATVAVALLAGLAALASGRFPHAHAQATASFSKGPLTITQPWSRATPGGAPVAGGYLSIANAGAEADKLIGGSSEIARSVEVHEMKMSNGIMQMRPVGGGLAVPAAGAVDLQPGGYHLMIMGLKHGLKEGDHFKVTLQFEKAGAIDVNFAVGGMAALAAPAPMDRIHATH